jgi:hypothetical protein
MASELVSSEAVSFQLSPFLLLLSPQGSFRPERFLHFLIARPPLRALNFRDALAYEFFRGLYLVELARVLAQKLSLVAIW